MDSQNIELVLDDILDGDHDYDYFLFKNVFQSVEMGLCVLMEFQSI